jgi:hypothetical protein
MAQFGVLPRVINYDPREQSQYTLLITAVRG